MKNLLFTILLHLILFHDGGSQSLLSGDLVTEQLVRMPSKSELLDNDYDGSPFLNDSFQNGTLTIRNQPGLVLPMRYNIYQDVMEVKFRGRMMQINPGDLIQSILLGKETLVPVKYPWESSMRQGLLFLLDSGKVNLYKKRNIQFEPWRAARAQEAGPKRARFKESLESFFLEFSNHKVVTLEKAKDLPLLFHDHRNELDDFFSKNKIKLKEDKLKELIHFYNSLQ